MIDLSQELLRSITMDIKANCIDESLELLEHIKSSKNIKDSKAIIDTICGNVKEIGQ